MRYATDTGERGSQLTVCPVRRDDVDEWDATDAPVRGRDAPVTGRDAPVAGRDAPVMGRRPREGAWARGGDSIADADDRSTRLASGPVNRSAASPSTDSELVTGRDEPPLALTRGLAAMGAAC